MRKRGKALKKRRSRRLSDTLGTGRFAKFEPQDKRDRKILEKIRQDG